MELKMKKMQMLEIHEIYKIHNLDLVKEYFGYSDQKAKEALTLLTDDDLELIRSKLNKGGNE